MVDDEATSQYLDLMYGNNRGHVAVAYKDSDASWQEHSFAWPVGKNKILAWLRMHADTGANVFVCPALRHAPSGRILGDGKALRWLWADVDMERIPTDRRARVRARVDKLGALVVASGTPGNAHVYVRLTREVSPDEHRRLNTGLRDYLDADNKHADNSLLRPPGTVNHKTTPGTAVHIISPSSRVFKPEALLALPTWQQVAKKTEAWTPVDIRALLRGGIKALVRMDTASAMSQYGSRFQAVYAVTRELEKKGYQPDVIHSLMDGFPPAKDKNNDEHGAYDIHKDIDRVLGGATTPDQADSDDATTDDDLANELHRRDIRRRADEIEAMRRFTAPPDHVSATVADLIAHPPQPDPFLIEGVVGMNHNVVITAQYKAGKTTLVACNLLRSLVDGTPFLDAFDIAPWHGNAAFWSCEMDPSDLVDNYLRPCGYDNPDRVSVAHLRGYNINILSDVGRAWTVKWLKTRGVRVWAIDSLARLARMAGVNENENDTMLDLLAGIDDIKTEAGVMASFVIAHTGRGEMEEGKERARGATAIDDWPDVRWIITEDSGVRFLSVENGRGGIQGFKATSLVFDTETKRVVYGARDKITHRSETGVQIVLSVVTETPGMSKNATQKKITERTGRGRNTALEWIDEAIDCGFIEVKRGPNRQQCLHPIKVEGVASARAIDMYERRAKKNRGM